MDPLPSTLAERLNLNHRGPWVKLSLLALVATGCMPDRVMARGEPVSTSARRPNIQDAALALERAVPAPSLSRPDFPHPAPFSSRLEDLAPKGNGAPPSEEWTEGLTATIDGVQVDEELGAALDERLDEFSSSEVNSYGVALLTYGEQLGADGLCEEPEIVWNFEEEGTEWEARLGVPTYMSIPNGVEPLRAEMPSACEDALLSSAGDVELALKSGCTEDDLHAFFEEDSACRACLEEGGGDFAACVDGGECPEEATTETWLTEGGEQVWYDMAFGFIYACAPSWTILTYVLTTETGPESTLPAMWDHESWSYICIPFWDQQLDDVSFNCTAGLDSPESGDALGEGLMGRVRYLRESGQSVEEDAPTPYYDRMYYTPRATMTNGTDLDRIWLFSDGGIGIISMDQTFWDISGDGVVDGLDISSAGGGWGINPAELRPDGQDPEELDDTFARDWLAAVVLKTATTIDGIAIGITNRTRCEDDAWVGPHEDGSWTCTATGLPDLAWQNDNNSGWIGDNDQVYAMPMSTIASTGLANPKIPGGILPLIAGSEHLANPHWEDCSWPDVFVPDHIRYEDDPDDWGGVASLDGNTWYFGKEGGPDYRLIINTNELRGFCPEPQGE